MSGAASARLFIALAVPAEVREALAGWAAPVVAEHVGALRAVAPHRLHLTLCFLGSRPVEEIEPIGDALTRAGGGRGFPLVAERPVWLPRRRPQVLAVEVGDPGGGLRVLQRALVAALVSGGWTERERRPFRPHITVARVRREAGTAAGVALPSPVRVEFEPTEVVLYRSQLDRGGTRYEQLRRVALDPPPPAAIR